jgi:H+/Cl- antiporter ClcA
MLKTAQRFPARVWEHRYGFTLFAYLVAAGITGVACVLFMRSFEFMSVHRLDFARVGLWAWITTPLIFLVSVELVRRLAPCADGTGIPQAIFAAKNLSPSTERTLRPLTSFLTLAVKIASLLLAIWAGASSGREGPTVHVATCIFLGVILFFRRFLTLKMDSRSAVVAGGAAGLAAAFNTPLAGVTFALEELGSDHFNTFKDYVIIAIIVSALTAKVLTGEYAYFGNLSDPPGVPLWGVLFIGVVGGLCGAFFSTAIIRGKKALSRFRTGRERYLVPVLLALGLLLVAAMNGRDVLGPGNLVAQRLTQGDLSNWRPAFPFAKILATLLTYWSGIAGGIFAPSLSIGSALGADAARLFGFSVAGCAIVGMAAFLSAAIQAPMTAFVIIFEMAGHHETLLPVMLAALIAYMTARVVGAQNLYQTLSLNYQFLLDPPAPPPPTVMEPSPPAAPK